MKLNESDLRYLINKIIKEAEYNYHIGDLKDTSNVKPYGSDNKEFMRGRDTGHFGSGVYFSTYNAGEKNSKVNHDENIDTPELIKINDSVFRVDFDLYKNLYPAKNKKQAEILFRTLHEINSLYYIIFDYYKYHEQLPKNFSERYVIIKNNLKIIDLKIPEYKKFIQMCKELIYDNTKRQSMSTVIMEYNGWNGVNVSGIYGFDNTKHGSVIYDMSKVSKDIRKVNYDYNNLDINYSHNNNNYIAGNIFDFKNKLLSGKDVINTYVDEFNQLPENEQIIAIKRYPYYLDSSTLEKLSQNIKNIYFKSLRYKIKNGILKKPEKYDIGVLIDNNMLNLIYDPSVIFEDGQTFLLAVLKRIYYLNSKQEEKLLNNINRPLTAEEQEELNQI